jgi:hypothetical protein
MLTLGELIEILHGVPKSAYEATLHGWGELISWRGDYSQLSLTSGHNISIGSAYTEACLADGAIFTGYKGGTFQMNLATKIYGDNYGTAYGSGILGIRFVLDKKNPTNPRAEMIREL